MLPWTEEAFVRLVDGHQEALRRVCCLCLGDAALAEDAVQETFLKAYRHGSRFRGESSERTWLTRIAINTCRDMRRTGWFRHVDRRVTPEELPLAARPFDPADEALTLAIMNLPPRLREAVTLRFYQGMEEAEMARVLGIGVTGVSNRLKRAREKLRLELEGGHSHE